MINNNFSLMNSHKAITALISELRKKQSENEEFAAKINEVKVECFSYQDNIMKLNDCNIHMLREIDFRRRELSEKKQQYDSMMMDRLDMDYVDKIKEKHITEITNKILEEKIPLYSGMNKKIYYNEFRGLMFDYVSIRLIKYETDELSSFKEDIQKFKISRESTFKDLKNIACNYWCLENEEDYMFADEYEALMYYDNMCVDEFLRNYSIFTSSLKMIPLSVAKKNTKLSHIIIETMRQANRLHKDKNKNVFSNLEEGSEEMKLKRIERECAYFRSEYPFIKPFYYEKKNEENKEVKIEKMSIDKSFFMLLLLFIFYIFCLVFIYNARSINIDSLNLEFINRRIDNQDVNDLDSLSNYLIDMGTYFIYPNISEINFTFNSLNYSTLSIENLDYYDQINILNDILIEDKKKKTDRFNNTQFYLYNTKINYIPCSSLHFIVANVNETESLEGLSNASFVFYNKAYSNRTAKTRYPSFYSSQTLRANELIGLRFNLKDSFLKLFENYFNESSIFKTAEQMKIKPMNLNLMTGYYDGSGYHIDFPTYTADNSFNYVWYRRIIEKIFPNNTMMGVPEPESQRFYITKSTRCLIIVFTLYIWESNDFVNVLITFEFLPTGVIKANRPQVRIFRADFYITWSLYVIDIFRFITIIILFLFLKIEIVEKRQSFKRDFFGTITLKMIYSIFMIVTFLINFFHRFFYLTNKEEMFFDLTFKTYKESFSEAKHYNSQFYMEALLFFATSLKIIDFLRMNDYVKLFFDSVDFGVIIYVKYMIAIIPTSLSFAVVAHIIWGPFYSDFLSIPNAYIQILLISIGNTNIQKFLNNTPSFCLIFLPFFFIFQIYFLSTILISLFAENFRKTVKRVGYPEDTQIKPWTLKDYVIWLCYFIDLESEEK